jgi:hypothetical protein
MLLLVLCIFVFQLVFSGETTTLTPVRLPSLIIIALAMVFAIIVLKLGLNDMTLALTADRRERAGDNFLKRHGPATAEEIKHFADEWDLRQFGVNSQDVDSNSMNDRALTKKDRL